MFDELSWLQPYGILDIFLSMNLAYLKRICSTHFPLVISSIYVWICKSSCIINEICSYNKKMIVYIYFNHLENLLFDMADDFLGTRWGKCRECFNFCSSVGFNSTDNFQGCTLSLACFL